MFNKLDVDLGGDFHSYAHSGGARLGGATLEHSRDGKGCCRSPDLRQKWEGEARRWAGAGPATMPHSSSGKLGACELVMVE